MTPLALLLALATPLQFDLSLGACVDAPVQEVTRLLRVELDALSARAGRTLGGVRVPVSVSCGSDGGATLRVVDPLTETTLERPLRLTRAAPSARARLLALSIVELLVTSWTDLERPARELAPAVDPEARRAAATIAATSLPAPARSAVRVYGAAGVFVPSSDYAAFAEAGARLEVQGASGLLASMDLRLGRAAATTTLGRVTLEEASATPAIGHDVFTRGRLAAHAALGARIGYARVAGTPFDPDAYQGASFAGVFVAPVVGLHGRVQLGGRVATAVSLEGGYVTRGVFGRVTGVREASLRGPWAAASLAVGFSL